jgi:hypothetical protein
MNDEEREAKKSEGFFIREIRKNSYKFVVKIREIRVIRG